MVLDPLIGRRLKLGIEALKSNCLFFQLQRKLIKGDVAVVDNRRILHARREFDSTSGKRYIRTTYSKRDELLSAIRIIERARSERQYCE